MRKVSFAVAIGLVVGACGGGEEPKVPEVAPPPVAATPPTTPAPTAEAPKEEPKPQPTMAELQQKAMKGYLDAMNAHDAKKIASFYTEDAVVQVAGAPEAKGREQIAANYQKMFDAFSNMKTAANRVWMKGDVVVLEWAFTGTHSGDLHGIKATEKPVGLMGADLVWFTPEGQMKRHHVYYDAGTFMSQIGVSKQKARAVPTLPASPQIFNAGNAADEAKNVELTKMMDAAFEQKKEADFLGTLADSIEWDDMTQPETSKGKDSAKKWFQAMLKAFPDGKVATTNSWGIGEYVIHEGNFTGTHKGPLFGIQPTKKTVNMHGLDIYQVKDGKVLKGWSYSNSAEMMTQLGLMKAPPAGEKKADAKAPAAGEKKADAKAPAAGEKKADAKAPAAPAKK